MKQKIQKLFSENATYQKFTVLKTNRTKRYSYREFFVEGVRNINEAISNHWEISSFLYSSEKPLSRWALDILNSVKTDINYDMTFTLLQALSNKTDSSEMLAIVKMKEDHPNRIKLSNNPIVALFDRPSNKGNLGTMIRSADACGIDGLIITGHAVDLYDPEVIVASMGSFFSFPAVRIFENAVLEQYIGNLKTEYPQFTVIGTTSHHQTSIEKVNLTVPILLMIGNETVGLNQTLKSMCDILSTIPMSEQSSASSFNVACAATVIFYEALRQRRLMGIESN